MKTWFSSRSGTWLLVGALLGLCLAFGSTSYGQEDKKEEAPPAVTTEAPATETPAVTEAPKTEETAATEEKKEEATEEAAAAPVPVEAQIAELTYALDTMMLFLSAVLVLFMQAGFAVLETGLNSAKNAVNIMFKNFMDMCIGVCLFYVIGFGIMYPGDNWAIHGVVGYAGMPGTLDTAEFSKDPTAVAGKAMHPQADFLFQLAFAATAATIVSGAVAGRMKLAGYLLYTVFMTALIYPISGSWKWGMGWLGGGEGFWMTDTFGVPFQDFAGSILVHAVGGFAGLAGAILLGPRLGRFVNGKSVPIPGHSITFAALGVFILWIGWYGFNPGSQLYFAGIANTNAVVTIAVNTTLAAGAGGVISLFVSWLMFGKPDLTMALNGALAGLVGITANCNDVTAIESFIIGGVAGVLVVVAIIVLEKLQIDDPVGAFPVHGVCGVWGGIATGIFGTNAQLVPQIIGSVAIPVWAFVTMFAFFALLKAVGLFRVSKEDELEGLDISEHGMYAYPAHQVHDGAMGHGSSAMASTK